jgi:hypothetical protein
MSVLEGLADRWIDVGDELRVPSLDVIESEHATNFERLKAVVRYWIQHDPYASWRRLVWRFDGPSDTDLERVANSIRKYAEPIAGQWHACKGM